MTGTALAFAAALLLFEAVHQAVPDRPTRARDLAWLAGLAAAAWLASRAFEDPDAFLATLLPLVVLNAVRLRAGLLGPGAGPLARWRYVPAAAVFAFTGNLPATAAAVLLLAIRRRSIRGVLLLASRLPGPFRLSPLDVDRILPAEVRYDSPESGAEAGVTMLEIIVSMTLLATVSVAIFTAVAGRAARLRQLGEAASAREAAVSEMERLGARSFRELAASDGATFEVPGDGEPGRVRVTILEPGLARIVVTAPRRGAASITLATLRSQEEAR